MIQVNNIFNSKKLKKLFKTKKMQNKRLISQNILQCNNQTVLKFSAFASFVAYKALDNIIKIKTFNKDIREMQIKFAKQITKWYFSSYVGKLLFSVEFVQNSLQIHEIDIVGNQIKIKLINKLENVKNSVALKAGIAYVQEQKFVKILKFQNYNNNSNITPLSICQCAVNSTIVQHQGEDIFILCPTQNPDVNILRIYNHNKTQRNYQESPLAIDYIKLPLAIFKDQFVFQENKQAKQIQIYNISVSKIVGKFSYEGQIIQTFIRNNILLIITSKQNMDKYYFYSLNTQLSGNKSILSHRSLYQKGKGAYFQAFCCHAQISEQITQGKQITYLKQLQKNNSQDNQQVILIYVQPAKKTKIQITRVSGIKIKEQAFKQNQMDSIILCKTQTKQKGISHKKIKSQKQALQIEKTKVNIAMNQRKSQTSIQQIQRKMIDHIVDVKIKGLLDKFGQLQKRLCRIEDQIVAIYAKIERSIQNINRQQIKNSVQNLFEKVTPQFESYFKEVFRQISGVLDQGVSYYTMKLSKQSDIHREAFNQIVNMTFDAAKEIVQLGRKELDHSEKTSENIKKLFQIRKKWETQSNTIADNFKSLRTYHHQNNHDINLSCVPMSPDKTSPPQNPKKN